MDSAGEAATKKSVKLCLAQDMAVKVVTLPKGKDAADVARDNPNELKKVIAEALPFMEYILRKSLERFDKETAEGKKKIADEMIEIIGSFESDVEKSHWIKKFSEEIDVAEEALTNTLKKANLRDKIGRFETDDRADTVVLKSKSEMLLEEILGLMLVSKEVWKKAVEEEKNRLSGFRDSLLTILLEKGQSLSFDLEALRREISSDRKLFERLENVYARKKYQLDLNNNPEELFLKDAKKDFEVCLIRIEIDEKKKELGKITGDLETAKKRKDLEAVKFLSQELSRITKKLAELMS
jgi:DNA primase